MFRNKKISTIILICFLILIFLLISVLIISFNIQDFLVELIFLVIASTVLAYFLSIYISTLIKNQLNLISEGVIKYSSNQLNKKIKKSTFNELNNLISSINLVADKIDVNFKKSEQQKNDQAAILSSMSEAVIAIDLEGKILMFNSSSSKLFDLDEKESIGKSIFGLIRNSDLINLFQSIIKKSDFEKSNIFLSSKSKYLNARGAPLINDKQQVIGAVIVFNDISKIKKLEEVRKEFVSNVSHELKTPITAIKGFVETMFEFKNNSDQKKFLKIIENHTNRLNSIIDDLLLLSRIEETEKIEKLDMKYDIIFNVIERSLIENQNLINDKNINVELDCDKAIKLYQNPRLLCEAISNLINNAAKYSSVNSKIKISVEETKIDVCINISDFGIGIEEKHIDRLFERFYRVDKSRSRDIGGTGLGLSIVKHIIKLHNGEILVHSKKGEGTRFQIKITKK